MVNQEALAQEGRTSGKAGPKDNNGRPAFLIYPDDNFGLLIKLAITIFCLLLFSVAYLVTIVAFYWFYSDASVGDFFILFVPILGAFAVICLRTLTLPSLDDPVLELDAAADQWVAISLRKRMLLFLGTSAGLGFLLAVIVVVLNKW